MDKPQINPERSDEPLHEGPERRMNVAPEGTPIPASVGEVAIEGVRREPANPLTDNSSPETPNDSQDLNTPTDSPRERTKPKGKAKGSGERSGSKGSDSAGLYLNEIGLTPLLTADEERELSKIIEKGREAQARLDADERGRDLQRAVRAAADAKDRFIRANLRLVVSVARRYPLPNGMELLDLIQEGNLGLEHAVDKFDWRKGFKFSTYATFWIRQAIGRGLDQKASLVRLPGDRSASLRSALRQVEGDGDELDDEHARLHRLTTPTSLDRTISDDDSSSLIDKLPDEDAIDPLDWALHEEKKEELGSLLDNLDTRARFAVEQRVGLHDGRKRSYTEVGRELGVTAEAARRLVIRSINIIRVSVGLDPTDRLEI